MVSHVEGLLLRGEADPQVEAAGPRRSRPYGSLTVCWPPQRQQCLHPGTRARLPPPE